MNRPNKKTSMEDGQVYELTGLLSSLDVTSPSRLHYLIHPLECPFSDAPISCSFVGFSRNAILEHTLETHHIQMDHSHQVTFFLKEYFDMIGMTAEYLHADQINKSVVHVCSLVSAEDDAHLREMIAQKKLDEMLSIQDSERTYFHKLPFTCIFCKEQYNNL